MAKAHIKKDDMVVVIAGADRGKSGRVLTVKPREDKVVVEGVNIRKHAQRRSQQNPGGGIVEIEGPVHISNVMLQEKYEARRSNDENAATKQEAE